LKPTGDHRRLSSLAELSFYRASVTTTALLLHGSGVRVRIALSGRRRRDAPTLPTRGCDYAYDLYNRGLTGALAGGGTKIDLKAQTFELPLEPSS
jgi:hypothetical protein